MVSLVGRVCNRERGGMERESSVYVSRNSCVTLPPTGVWFRPQDFYFGCNDRGTKT